MRLTSIGVSQSGAAWLGVVLSLASGCGSDDNSAEERLKGSWSVMTSDGFDCSMAITFGDDGFIEVDRICSLEGGGYGLQATIGMYEMGDDGTSFRWFATDSTCAKGASFSERATFEFPEDDRLRLVLAGSARTWRRSDPDELPDTYVFGCFDKDGGFTPGRLRPL